MQTSLFPNDASESTSGKISGLIYRPEFVSESEEQTLLRSIAELTLTNATYRQYTARRRTISFGATYDFTHHQAIAAPPLPAFLDPLLIRAAAWADVNSTDFVQALIAEYQPGTPLGWHRDVPDYELVVGVSLGTSARMRLRPYPWTRDRAKDVVALELLPRSAYLLRGAARWQWQHSVPPVKTLRYSITLRTANLRREFVSL
jgi:alkylated DNA repair dioxygenase AlkB